jgi:hypothetical protein
MAIAIEKARPIVEQYGTQKQRKRLGERTGNAWVQNNCLLQARPLAEQMGYL